MNFLKEILLILRLDMNISSLPFAVHVYSTKFAVPNSGLSWLSYLDNHIFFLVPRLYLQNTNFSKIGIIMLVNRNDKVIPQIKLERYNIIEVNDNAD